MTKTNHHVIIGSGVAGSQAAETLRQQDPESRVTIITLSSLLFYNRYDLPQVFKGKTDWRQFLVYPPDYYDDKKIVVRRNSKVANVDSGKRVITLAHQEEVYYDKLLVASGGRGYLPEELTDFRPLMDHFATYEQAMTVKKKLQDGGRAVLLGGDMIGLDLARTLVETGHKVALVAGEHTFWPHRVSAEERARSIAALEKMGIEVIENDKTGGIAAIEEGAKGMPARRITFKDGSDVLGDVVMPFFGLVPSVEFMLGSGVDIERGLLVSPELKTTDENIYAAGDVCQIWSKEENRYRFYYGWKNVRAMGDRAAKNMILAPEPFLSTQVEQLTISKSGQINSPFWEYA